MAVNTLVFGSDLAARFLLSCERMDGSKSVGHVLAIDHDRLFKELQTTFFVEFLELFFPKLAESLDRDSIEFLSQEYFANVLEGDK